MDLVVAYDIHATDTSSGSARLRRVSDICAAYGERAQRSVFECRLGPEHATRLINELNDAIDQAVDSVIIYRIVGDVHNNRTILGVDRPHRLGSPWIG